MSMVFSLLMLAAVQDAPAAAQDAPFKHGVWSGQCWRHASRAGHPVAGFCRATGGQASRLWIMIERHAGQLDVYASGSCSDDTGAVSVSQAQLAGGDRVAIVGAAIGEAVLKVNQACKTQEVYPGNPEDLAALLVETDGLEPEEAK